MKPSKRKYTGPLQYFHNYEHDEEGRTHCLGPKSNPYVIAHKDGKHLINAPIAKGHGKGGEPKWFKFKKAAGGFDLSTGKVIPVEEVNKSQKKAVVKNKLFDNQKKKQIAKKRSAGH